MNNSAEQTFVGKLVDALSVDNDIRAYTKGRVYASHISSIQEPTFPAISIFIRFSKARFESPNSIDLDFQVDCWFPTKGYTQDEMLKMLQRIREIVHRGNFSGVKATVYESGNGPVLYEEDSDLFHFPVIFKAVVL